MTDETTSALIAAYKACARPSAATHARLWATLEAADETREAGSRRSIPRSAPWLALAACLVLVAAWRLDLPRLLASGHVLEDTRQQAAYDAATASPEAAVARDGTGNPSHQPEATLPEEHELEAIGAARQPQQAKHAHDARQRQAPAAQRTRAGDVRPPTPGPVDSGGDDRVLEEMALLQRAQAALRDGRASAALELLAQHAETFVHGSMIEERQALRVLALCASGEAAHGSTAAAAFLRAHPRSTYAARVRAACAQQRALNDTSTSL